MTRILTLALAAAALSLASCAAVKKDCDSCCAPKPAVKKDAKCEACESGKTHKH